MPHHAGKKRKKKGKKKKRGHIWFDHYDKISFFFRGTAGKAGYVDTNCVHCSATLELARGPVGTGIWNLVSAVTG